MSDDAFDDPYLEPDVEEGKADETYKWDEEFQRHIIAMLLCDKNFLMQSMSIVRPSYFTNKAHQKLCSVLFKHFEKYRVIPDKTFVLQEIKNSLSDNKSLPYYVGEVRSLTDYFQPGLEHREYLQDKIKYFAKMQAFRKAFNDGLRLMEKNPESEETWDKIHEIIRQSMMADMSFEVGIKYFSEMRERYERMEEDEHGVERYMLGLPGIDCETKGRGYGAKSVVAVVADSGVGKCHPKNTPVLMYDGAIKMVQDVRVGDLVMGDDSEPRRVLSLHNGFDDLYDVIPIKGDKYTVTSRHTLVLRTASKFIDEKNRCINPRYWNSPYHVGGGIFEIEAKDYLKQSKLFKSCMKGYKVGVEWPETDVRLDPYVLGVWLGDGTSRTTEITTGDSDVVCALEWFAETRGLQIKEKEVRDNCIVYSINTGVRGSMENTFLNDLRYYNVLNNKHVPQDYKINSRKVRLQILAGLLDSDGSKSNNCFDFINKNPTLAEDVVFLARSLGFAAYSKPCRKKSQDGVWGDYWRVTISGHTDEIPVKIERKQCQSRKQIKDVLSTGITVKHAGKGQYYGFETDGNHRFLLGDFTVVHNSVMLANVCATNLMRGRRGIYITLEISEDEVGERMDAILTGLPVQTLLSDKGNVFNKIEELEKSGKLHSPVGEHDTPFIIKQFPPKKADVNTLRAYINQLKFYNFKPDFMIVDYVAGLKHHADMKTYESRELLVEELHALAVEEDIFIATAMQPNRGSKEAQKEQHKHLGQEHLADAYGAMRPLTGCVMLMQNDTESALDIGRGWVEKQRHGRSKYFIYLKFDRRTLRFTEISKDDYLEILSSRKGDVITDIETGSGEKKTKTKKGTTLDDRMKDTIKGWEPSHDKGDDDADTGSDE